MEGAKGLNWTAGQEQRMLHLCGETRDGRVAYDQKTLEDRDNNQIDDILCVRNNEDK
jgi:hypothetical protein